MTTSKRPATKLAPKSDPNALVVKVKPDQTESRAMADLAANGVASSAYVIQKYNASTLPNLDLAACVASLASTAKAVHSGDLKPAEAMLVAQAAALSAIFGELARRAALNMGEYPDAFERYLRLALKAQGQCRATLETLAAIRSPPVVYARQANFNNGGQQQVNNAAAPSETRKNERAAQPAVREAVQCLPTSEPATIMSPVSSHTAALGP